MILTSLLIVLLLMTCDAYVAGTIVSIQATRAWAEVASEWYGRELGHDSPQAEEMRRVVGQPTLHGMWGQRQRELVGGLQ